jgi:DNA-binding NarL/FixJ family response regulator
LIADDAASTRRFLRVVLEYSRDFVVVGEAIDGDESVELAAALQPDVVLLDLAMPLSYGVNALRRIRLAAPNASVVVVSALDPALQMPVLEAGAVAFIPKGATPLEFLTRLEAVLERSLSVERLADQEVAPSRHKRAVVFADEPITRRLVTRVLDRCNVIVVAETDSGSTLLEVVGSAKPDVVVLGLSMTGKHNLDVVAEIRHRFMHSTVIVYSAREKWQDKALSSGAAAFVVHPRINQLIQHIEGSPIVQCSSNDELTRLSGQRSALRFADD